MTHLIYETCLDDEYERAANNISPWGHTESAVFYQIDDSADVREFHVTYACLCHILHALAVDVMYMEVA